MKWEEILVDAFGRGVIVIFVVIFSPFILVGFIAQQIDKWVKAYQRKNYKGTKK